MVVDQKYTELVQLLVDKNVDLHARIDKQKEDITYYSYFLLLIYSLFNRVSYFEGLIFVKNIKKEFKGKSKKSEVKTIYSGMLIQLYHSQSIHFAGEDNLNYNPFLSQDSKMIQILLLSFLEDNESLFKLFTNQTVTEFHKLAIFHILSIKYSRIKSKDKRGSNSKRASKIKKQLAILSKLVNNKKTIE
jgi:hypothetical protein